MKRILCVFAFGLIVASADLVLMYIIHLHDSGQFNLGGILALLVVVLHSLLAIPAAFFVGSPALVFLSIFVFWSFVAFIFMKIVSRYRRNQSFGSK